MNLDKILMSDKFKKTFWILISIGISVCGVLSVAFGVFAQDNNKYDVYLASNNVDIENVKISGIYYSDAPQKLERYSNNDSYLKYDSENKNLYLEKYKKNKPILSFETSRIDNIAISFSEADTEYEVSIYKNDKFYQKFSTSKDELSTFFDRVSVKSVLSQSIIHSTVSFKLLLLLLLFVFLALSLFMIKYIYDFILAIQKGNFKIIKFGISALFLLVLNIMYLYIALEFVRYLAILPMFVILFYILYIMRDSLKGNLHYSFAIISIFVGTLMIILMPPFHVPDEVAHFMRSFQMSYTFQDKHEVVCQNGKEGCVYLPEDTEQFIRKYGEHVGTYGWKFTPKTYFYDLFHFTDYSVRSHHYRSYNNTKFCSPIPYIIGAIVSLIGRLVHIPILLITLLSKSLTLIVSSLMLYLAIKKVPRFKKIFFLIGLLPIFLQQANGFNMDWLTNSTALLFIATVIEAASKKEQITKKEILFMLGLLLLLCFCKFGYFPLAFLLFLIPKKRFSFSKKKYIVYNLLAIAMTAAICIGINLIYRKLNYVPGYVGIRGVCYSMKLIFTDPLKIAIIVLKTIRARFDMDFFKGFVTCYGWSTVITENLFLFINLVLLVAMVLVKDEKVKTSISEKMTMFITFVAICAIIYASMLFTWTPVGYETIDGLQTRYFIPALPLLYILLQNSLIELKTKNKELVFGIVMTIMNLLAFVTIIIGFYY